MFLSPWQNRLSSYSIIWNENFRLVFCFNDEVATSPFFFTPQVCLRVRCVRLCVDNRRWEREGGFFYTERKEERGRGGLEVCGRHPSRVSYRWDTVCAASLVLCVREWACARDRCALKVVETHVTRERSVVKTQQERNFDLKTEKNIPEIRVCVSACVGVCMSRETS